jgi:hypothetical protein
MHAAAQLSNSTCALTKRACVSPAAMPNVPLCACSVNDAVLNSPANPLLVINQRLQAMMAQQRKQKKCGGAQRQAGGGGASGPATGRSTLSAAAAAALSGGITGRALTPAAAPGGLIMSPRMPLPLTSAAAAQ